MADCVIFQGYLQKTPPLDKLIVSWKKRYFILSQIDPFDPRSVQLTYYTDSKLEEKRGAIDLPSITRIHPSPSKSKGHIFSIEIKDRKFMLKADDARTKDIWIAKLYEFAGLGHNYHVTVPNQPLAAYNEGLLQLGRADSEISINPPTSNNPILNVSYKQIRRFGYQVVMENYDVIWFELCHCRDHEQDFCFFVVASGMDRAMLIAGDLKKKIEKDTGRFLIMEDDKHPETTYISRTHYGCAPYPKLGRERVLHAGLVNLEANKIIKINSNHLGRRLTEPDTHQLLNPANERRNTVQSLLGIKTPNASPRHSPAQSPSPSRSSSPHPSGGAILGSSGGGGTTLQDLKQRGHSRGASTPGSTSDPTCNYTGKTLSAFEQGRRSDGVYLTHSDGASKLSDWKNKRPSEPYVKKSGKLSLADLKIDRVGSNGSGSEKFFPSKDSGIGTSADLVLDQEGRMAHPFRSPSPSPSPYSKGSRFSPNTRQKSSYDHLGPQKTPPSSQVGYDRLSPTSGGVVNGSGGTIRPPVVPPRSGVSMGDPYLEF